MAPEQEKAVAGLRCVRRTARYAVFDDVFSPEDFSRIWEYVQLDEFMPAHHARWEKAWRLSDGQPLVGVLVRHELEGHGGDAKSTDGRPARTFPTRGGIDLLIGLLLEQHEELAEWIGRRGTDWTALTARPYLYPAGTALAWHTDAFSYSGAFVYYSHRQWGASWGGELLLSDDSTAGADLGDKYTLSAVMNDGKVVGLRRVPTPPALEHEQEERVLMGAGLGDYVMAKPNRLVIMKAGTPHRIARVDQAAGENVRCSIGGCFLRTQP